MKLLQGNLKETLFEWPGKKGAGEMLKKSERVLKRNQCAYINGKSFCFGIFKFNITFSNSDYH